MAGLVTVSTTYNRVVVVAFLRCMMAETLNPTKPRSIMSHVLGSGTLGVIGGGGPQSMQGGGGLQSVHGGVGGGGGGGITDAIGNHSALSLSTIGLL